MARNMATLTLLMIVAILWPRSSSAQERAYCHTCFRGKPSPGCCSFFIFEAGYLATVFRSGERPGKEAGVLTSDLGVMFNVWGSKAIGGSFHLAADDDGTRLGVGPRYRAWLKDGLALDLSPRVLFSGNANYGIRRKFPGLAISASVSLKDYLSFDAYYQLAPYEQLTPSQSGGEATLVDHTESGVYLGVAGRSYLAPVVPLALAVLVAATWNN